MGRSLEGVFELIDNYFFEVASLLIASGALIYAARAFRVAKQALASAEGSDLAALKLKAHEGRARAQRSFLSLQSACHEMRGRWNVHHDRHYPRFGSQDSRHNDTRHISEVEREGRNLLSPLEQELPENGVLNSDALEDYIQRAEQAAMRIEQLTLRLSPPKPLIV